MYSMFITVILYFIQFITVSYHYMLKIFLKQCYVIIWKIINYHNLNMNDKCLIVPTHQGPLLLTWFNFNPRMDM